MAPPSAIYPPILETYAPTFTGSECKVWFQISPYMERKDSYQLEIVVNEQRSNASALKNADILTVTSSSAEEGDYLLYDYQCFSINANDLKEGFALNTFYRVQARIVENGIKSEWSTVCLVRRIPNISLSYLLTSFSSPLIELNGQYSFEPEGEVEEKIENIKEVKVRLIQNNLLLDTQIIKVNENEFINENNFSYKPPMKLSAGTYIVSTEATTTNGYVQTNSATITISSASVPISSIVEAALDKENGLIEIKVDIQDSLTNKQIIILRTDSESNFRIWEQIHITPLANAQLGQTYIWQDKTIKYGVFYKYSAQLANGTKTEWSPLAAETPPIYADFEDTFLTTQNKQLKITLNKSISSYGRQVKDAVIETLGGEYPYIVRNGHTKYFTFPISGTISYLGNNEEALFAASDIANNNLVTVNKSGMFETKQTIYGENEDIYNEYNLNNNISDINNTYLERVFRERVEEFINDFTAKLYRSPTEGNLIVQLTELSFVPNTSLGNYIYDFSCTATEIGECNIENYDKYHIQYLGSLENENIQINTVASIEKVGQV